MHLYLIKLTKLVCLFVCLFGFFVVKDNYQSLSRTHERKSELIINPCSE